MELQKVLKERAHELAEIVQGGTGLSTGQSRRLVEETAEDLVAAFVWQAGEGPPLPMDSAIVARNVMEGIPGRAVAERVGLPPARTWDGIRVLVPVVLRSAAREASPEA